MSWFGIHGSVLIWSRTCHLIPSVSYVIILSHPCIPPTVVFFKAPFWVPCFSSCRPTLRLAVLSSPPFPWTTTFMQTTLNFFLHSPTHIYKMLKSILYMCLQQISSWMTANLLTLNSYSLDGLKKQLNKTHNSLNTTHCARMLGFIFDKHLTFSKQISALSKSCYCRIRQLRCVRPFDSSTTATSIVYSELDYYNFFSTTSISLR